MIITNPLKDFFSRNNTGPEGNKDLPYHLFCQGTDAFETWNTIASEIGLVIREDQWVELTASREAIFQEADDSVIPTKIDSFNTLLKNSFIENIRANPADVMTGSSLASLTTPDSELSDDELFSRRLYRFSELVSLNDTDLKAVIGRYVYL